MNRLFRQSTNGCMAVFNVNRSSSLNPRRYMSAHVNSRTSSVYYVGNGGILQSAINGGNTLRSLLLRRVRRHHLSPMLSHRSYCSIIREEKLGFFRTPDEISGALEKIFSTAVYRADHVTIALSNIEVHANASGDVRFEMVKRVRRAIELSGERPTIEQYECMLRVYSRCDSTGDDFWSLVSEMDRYGIRFELGSYTSIAYFFMRTKNIRGLQDVMKDMQTRGIDRDEHFYRSMVVYLAREREIESSLAVLNRMADDGVPPTVETYTAALSASSQVGDVNGALRFHDAMIQNGIAPNVVSFTQLLQLYADAGRISEAKQTIINMKSRDVRPNVVTYTVLINMYGQHGCIGDALNVLSEMCSDQVSPNSITYIQLLRWCRDAVDLPSAEKVISHMKMSGLSHTKYTISTMMSLYGRASVFDHRVINLMAEMEENGIVPDRILFNSMLHVYRVRGDIDSALNLISQMRSKGVRVDVVSYTVLMHTYASSGNVAGVLGTLADMKHHRVVPNTYTLSAILQCYKNAHDTAGSFIALQNFVNEYNLAPYSDHYEFVAFLAADSNDYATVIDVFDYMVKNHVPVSMRFRKALIKSWLNTREPIIADIFSILVCLPLDKPVSINTWTRIRDADGNTTTNEDVLEKENQTDNSPFCTDDVREMVEVMEDSCDSPFVESDLASMPEYSQNMSESTALSQNHIE